MKHKKNKYQTVSLRKVFPAIGMMLLLVLLTSMNFFIYPSSLDDKAKSCWASTAGGDEESPENSSNPCPAGPDEKSPNKPISVNEEYIHEGPEVSSPFWDNPLFEHKIHETEKLQIVHFELITPPPKA
jgi:hypothetical protein